MKSKLTFERHVELGAKLFEMQQYLVHLIVEVGKAYPLRSKHMKHMCRAEASMCSLRSEMEEQLFRDYPDKADIFIYYSPTRYAAGERHENHEVQK